MFNMRWSDLGAMAGEIVRQLGKTYTLTMEAQIMIRQTLLLGHVHVNEHLSNLLHKSDSFNSLQNYFYRQQSIAAADLRVTPALEHTHSHHYRKPPEETEEVLRRKTTVENLKKMFERKDSVSVIADPAPKRKHGEEVVRKYSR